VRLVRFEPAHLAGLELRDFDRLGVAGQGGGAELPPLAELYAASGPAFSAFTRDGLAACGGVAMQPGATGNAWMFTGPLVRAEPVALARTVRRELDRIQALYGLSRIQTTAHVSLDLPPRWLEFLGFTREARLARLVGDDDYYLYARV